MYHKQNLCSREREKNQLVACMYLNTSVFKQLVSEISLCTREHLEDLFKVWKGIDVSSHKDGGKDKISDHINIYIILKLLHLWKNIEREIESSVNGWIEIKMGFTIYSNSNYGTFSMLIYIALTWQKLYQNNVSEYWPWYLTGFGCG